MTRDELLVLIRNGENSGVEFKREWSDPRAFAKELVALANMDGGRVLMGVNDDGTVVGVTQPDLEERVMTAARDKVRPELIPYFEMVRDVEPGRDVAVVRVDRGWTVHHVWHDNHRTYYIRVGSQSREASQDELARLLQQRGALRSEIQPVSRSGIGDIDMRRVVDYFGRVRNQDVPDEEDRAGWQSLLVNTEFLSDEDEAIPCTIAGLLVFGIDVHRFLPHAGVDAVAYPGTEKDYAAIERASLIGPLVGLFKKGNGGFSEGFSDGFSKGTVLLEPGVIEMAISFVKRNAGVHAVLADGARRVETPTYPDDVIREALVNAVVHRDYLLSGTRIELSLYADRLEIISPGRLPNGITPERMRHGCRAARNQLLKDVLRDYGYLEHMGMGIPRKIIKGMRQHNGTDPELIEGHEEFTLRLWKSRDRS